MFLYFEPMQQSLETVANPVPLKKMHSRNPCEKWNKDQIDDFVRKLGFLEKQDVEQTVKQFQRLNEVSNCFITVGDFKSLQSTS